ncbi:MAG: ribosome biogenesis GTPase YlqF [Eubacterium sp.]|nr:ribosome biogenesis GTPase YlqF [Eubacterium sp.]
MDYQWYPGHMTKAIRQMREDIKLVDLVIELLDARIPLSSRNPDIDILGQNKARLVILNKSDLADESQNSLWEKNFNDKGYTVLKIDSRVNTLAKTVDKSIAVACKDKIESNKKKGVNRPIRAMVVGIPNVGKSTFINSYAKKTVAKTGNKPGVTKGKQWIKIGKNLELLDTPGILWPKFGDDQIGLNLALIGSMNDNNLDAAELAFQFIKQTRVNYPNILMSRYNIEGNEDIVEEMYQVAEVRNCKLPGNKLDLDKASKIILDDFRSGKLGKITLDRI